MEQTPANTTKKPFYQHPLFIITIVGFLIRLALVIFVLTGGRSFSQPYFIADDIKYESLAKQYIYSASHIFDMTTFDNITRGYLQLFWPWVMCVSGYIFKSVYVGRFINVILSSLCVPMMYKISKKLSASEKTALVSAGLFSFMPVAIITCVFPIKDIFITLGVLTALYFGLKMHNEEKIKWWQFLLLIVLLVCVRLTRGAVVELIMIYYAAIMVRRFIIKKNHLALVLFFAGVVLFMVFFGSTFIGSFETKIDDYSSFGNPGSGGLFSLRVNGLRDIYKLPLAYFFATLQPIKTNLFTFSGTNLWLSVLTMANIAIYPVAIGNFIYIFTKKKNFLFWLFTAVFFCAVIILSLSIFRHYLFLAPIAMINYSQFLEQNRKTNLILTIALSVLLLCGVFMLSVINL